MKYLLRLATGLRLRLFMKKGMKMEENHNLDENEYDLGGMSLDELVEKYVKVIKMRDMQCRKKFISACNKHSIHQCYSAYADEIEERICRKMDERGIPLASLIESSSGVLSIIIN